MNIEELEQVKAVLKRLHTAVKEEWIEKQLLRNPIIDSGWFPEEELDSELRRGKSRPENVLVADENFAASEQSLAELGIEHWLANFDTYFPKAD